MAREEHLEEFVEVQIAILTVSDTRSRRDDTSGDLLEKRVIAAGHRVVARNLLRDERKAIAQQLLDWAARPDIDAIMTTGGTGLTGRDVTVEAHQDVYDKDITAFGTMFAIVSMEKIGTSAVQSRACAGVVNGTYCFALPGSPGACADAWDRILQPQFDLAHRPCNFVEIMPRLNEHLRQ
ncbi:MAG: molybdopterin-binding protein [Rhodobacteraceae bacterium]|nr:molybdopterin-binding protein [Paracoccaceae bacterium]